MELIFGGAYQGRLEYAKSEYNLTDEDIFFCSDDRAEIDISKPAVYCIEKFLLACIRAGLDPAEEFADIYDALADKIVICTDISQGIVPVDRELRMWREAAGRAMVRMAKDAQTVTRVFAGLPLALKQA
jgi:hypothetical protein